jgi:hypothetical protein
MLPLCGNKQATVSRLEYGHTNNVADTELED